MTDFAAGLEEAMRKRNFFPDGKINYSADGKWQRFANAGGYKRAKDLFVILHDYDRGATFGDWHYPDDWYTYWNPAYRYPTVTEQVEMRRERDRLMALQKIERSKREWRAQIFWVKFYLQKYVERHPYSLRKQIRPYYARRCRSWLLIPVSDVEQNLKTVQIIKPNGFKRLWKGTSTKGNMVWLSEKLPADYDGFIRVCEGYATGCAIYEAGGGPVVCALNARNLMPTVVSLMRHFQHAGIKVCADNDAWGKTNPGLIYARQVCERTGASLHYPVFDKEMANLRPTDFNDLLVVSGIEAVERQLILLRK